MKAQEIASLLLLILSPIVATAAPDEASGTVVSVIDAKTFEVMIEKTDPRIQQIVERVTLADILIPNGSIDGSVEDLIDESLNGSADEPMDVSLNGSADEPMDVSLNGSADEPMDISLNGSADEPMDVSLNGSVDEQIDESLNGLLDEAWDGPVDELLNDTFNGSISGVASAEDFAVAILLNKTVWLDIDDRSPDGRNSEGELVAVLRLSGLDGRPVISPTFNRMLVDCGIAEVNDSLENEFDPSEWWPTRMNGSKGEVSGEEAGEKIPGLNIDIKPSRPEVNINLSKPKVNVSLSGLNVDINPRKPVIDVNPKKPIIDVNPNQANATDNETSDPFDPEDTDADGDYGKNLWTGDGSEPVILRNLTVPVTLVDLSGTITVINSTGEVTVIDPARPVKVINSTDIEDSADITGLKPAGSFQGQTKIAEPQIDGLQPSTKGGRK